MVSYAEPVPICQLLDMAHAVIPFYQHSTVEMQHLHTDSAYQEREHSSLLPVWYDGRTNLD